MLQGRCVCERVRFEVRGELGPPRLCHCHRCQRATGTAFSANSRVAASDVRFIAGREDLTHYPVVPGWTYAFCSRCGSGIYAQPVDDPSFFSLRLGTLEGDPGIRPASHVWIESRAPWFEVTDTLPQHPRGAP